MSRNHTLWIGLLVLAGATLACIGGGEVSSLPTGEQAPNFGVKINDKTITLDDLAGDVVVVNFWSSS